MYEVTERKSSFDSRKTADGPTRRLVGISVQPNLKLSLGGV